jgi:hypothetical protein
MPIGEELTNELHQKRSTIILSPMGTCHLGMVVRIAVAVSPFLDVAVAFFGWCEYSIIFLQEV